MAGEISISERPRTDGATQTRSVGVSVTTPTVAPSYQVTVDLSIDATQNGSFRELKSATETYEAGSDGSISFTPFIGVKPPYDLRATATFQPTVGGVQQDTAVETITVDGSQIPSRGGVSAADFDLAANEPSVRGGDPADVTPRIGPVEPIVQTAEYQLPWDRDNNQTACGQTIQTQNGDFNWRIVFSGVITLSQLDELRSLRNNASKVETRSAVFGVRSVDFDQLNVTRSSDPSVINVDGSAEPLYEFQLQTKELDEQTDSGLFGGN